jgi:hypothetical protein
MKSGGWGTLGAGPRRPFRLKTCCTPFLYSISATSMHSVSILHRATKAALCIQWRSLVLNKATTSKSRRISPDEPGKRRRIPERLVPRVSKVHRKRLYSRRHAHNASRGHSTIAPGKTSKNPPPFVCEIEQVTTPETSMRNMCTYLSSIPVFSKISL